MEAKKFEMIIVGKSAEHIIMAINNILKDNLSKQDLDNIRKTIWYNCEYYESNSNKNK